MKQINLWVVYFIAVCLPSISYATDYFVAPHGDDSAAGTRASPWKSIAYAVGSSNSPVQAGDTVNVLSGTYLEQVRILKSGTESAPITIRVAEGHRARITGVDDSTGKVLDIPKECGSCDPHAGLVTLVNAQYVKLQGFEIDRSSYHGIYAAVRSGARPSNLELSNLTVTKSAQDGIRIKNSDEVLVRSNLIDTTSFDNPGDTSPGIYIKNSHGVRLLKNETKLTTSSGIGVWNSNDVEVDQNRVIDALYTGIRGEEYITIANTDDFTVSGNVLRRNFSPYGDDTVEQVLGIDVKSGSDKGVIAFNDISGLGKTSAIYIDAWIAGVSNVDIYNNRISDMERGITLTSEQGGTVDAVRVYNNLLFNVTGDNIDVSENDGICNCGNGLRSNITIDNNTIIRHKSSNAVSGIGIHTDNIRNISVRNNIVYHAGTVYTRTLGISSNTPNLEITSLNNIGYSDKPLQGYSIGGVNVNELWGVAQTDPQFYSAEEFDARLLETSPAIDQGIFIPHIRFDASLYNKPETSRHDIGALEFRKNTLVVDENHYK